jgi:hypothetical protein
LAAAPSTEGEGVDPLAAPSASLSSEEGARPSSDVLGSEANSSIRMYHSSTTSDCEGNKNIISQWELQSFVI